MKKIALFILCMILAPICLAQGNTIGTMLYNPDKTMPGFTLFFPAHQGTAWLVNSCGEVVHFWADTLYKPGEGAYLQPDGSIFLAKGRDLLSNPVIHSGGGGEKIEHLDWDNNLLWTFTYNDSSVRMHHDFTVLPNGNVILIAWERKLRDECIAGGRDTSLLSGNELWPDHLVEVQPVGADSGIIVWEWHAWDHLVQDFDSTKSNYGIVADHPERIDMNYNSWGEYKDMMHSNTVDYNPQLDMLMISVPLYNEVWVIDHSTTSAEAATHSGGRAGRGGDLLWRWGNPAAYRRADTTAQKFFFQHDTHWLDIELSPSDPDFGKMGVFNNRLPGPTSEAAILSLPFDSVSWSFGKDSASGTFLPLDYDRRYTTPNPTTINSAVVSSVQKLPNGNLLICAGRKGFVFEVTPDDEIVWEYRVPLYLGERASQGTVPPEGTNLTFKMRKYSSAYPAFAGRDLTPIDYLELNPDTAFCDSLRIGADDMRMRERIFMFPNPASDFVQIISTAPDTAWVEVTDIFGRRISCFSFRREYRLDVSQWVRGLYLVRGENGISGKILVE